MPNTRANLGQHPINADTFDLVNDLAELVDSMEVIVPCVSTAAGDTVATARASAGFPVTDARPLFIYNTTSRILQVKDSTGWRDLQPPVPPTILLRKNSQSANATSNAWTDMLWEIEDYKTGLTHATNAAEITVPTNGIYDLKAKLGCNLSGLTVGVQFNINGVDITYTINNAASAAGAFDKAATTHDLKLNAGDIIKVRGRVNSTTTVFDTATCSASIFRKIQL